MSTTRHHINRQRRRQARVARPAATATPAPRGPGPATDGESRTVRSRPRRPVGLVALCALTLLLGAFAGWAHAEAESLRAEPARSNTALTDLARTSEIKGQVAEAVDRLFSYDHADPGAFDKAAKDLLTGRAVTQHRDLLADVRERADAQKAVITTTVTETGVERIDGDRARVLVYADQSSVATAGGKAGEQRNAARDEGVYAAAMLAVDVVHRDGRWLVSGLDTFGRP
ncbi:hypothetical protein ACIQUO_10670 [Streptomyces albogriseolus]|uniref:hypothetical protein n=1 Tax=Streptomyces TaxID=1883 RepID=UPI00224F694C|nr:hypothetical protein [Streptomyces viridodiastaticus]MCX4566712.1 hypothetical protein [Streptomyces viridodiastaticus]